MNNTNAQLFLHAQAELVRVEGMKQENKAREHRMESPAYTEDDFERSACTIEGFAQAFYFGTD